MLRAPDRELSLQGQCIGRDTVVTLPEAEGYSLQGPSRTPEGPGTPAVMPQFRYFNDQAGDFTQAGQPAISTTLRDAAPALAALDHVIPAGPLAATSAEQLHAIAGHTPTPRPEQ